MKPEFYDKEIYQKRPTSEAEAKTQLAAIMDDMVIRDNSKIKYLLKVAVIGIVLELVIPLICVKILHVGPPRLWSIYGTILAILDVLVGTRITNLIHDLNRNKKAYRLIKEQTANWTIKEDIIDYTNRMIDAALDDMAKGR